MLSTKKTGQAQVVPQGAGTYKGGAERGAAGVGVEACIVVASTSGTGHTFRQLTATLSTRRHGSGGLEGA